MKRIISILLILTLALSFTSFAATASVEDFNKAFNDNITYMDIDASFTTNITKMSDEVKAVLKALDKETENEKKDYNISIATDNFLTSKVSVISKEYISGTDEIYELKQYYDVDLTYKRPLFAVMLKYPDIDTFVLYNMIDVPELNPYIYNLKEYIYKVNESEGIVFDKRGTVKNGVYTLTLDDHDAKTALISFINSSSPIMATTLRYYGADLGNNYSEIFSDIGDIKLFADNGFKLEATLDKNGKPDKINLTLKLDTNLYELYKALEDKYADVSTDGLTKANSQIKSTVTMSVDFNNINAKSTVELPQLTSDNTYSYTGDMLQQYFSSTISPNKINIYANNKRVIFEDASPVIENDRTLVPLRKFLNSIGVNDNDIIYDDGYITVTYGEKTVKLNVFDTNASVTENGETKDITLDVSAKMVNDRTLVPLRFLGETFNCQVIYQELDATTVFINVVQLD